MNKAPSNIRSLLIDIYSGSSEATVLGQNFYIRHPQLLTDALIEEEYSRAFDRAVINGLETNEQIIERAIKNGQWKKEKDEEIKSLQFEIASLEKLKSKQQRAISLSDIDKSLDEKLKRIREINESRSQLLLKSAEAYANTKAFNYRVLTYCFKNKECSVPLFNQEDFYDLSDADIVRYVITQNETLEQFKEDNLKWIAFSEDFLLTYKIYKNAPHLLFPNVSSFTITFYQKNLIHLAERIFGILSSGAKIPENYWSHPDLILNFNPEEEEKKTTRDNKIAKLAEMTIKTGKEVSAKDLLLNAD